ncbi:MAG: hypothetical protein M8349_08690 [ANME-2 cluster archaeon]|nr:hypothetical protein [ANME-2 cluster archaeon]
MVLRGDRPSGTAVKEKQMGGEIIRSLHTGPTYQVELACDGGMKFEIELPLHSHRKLGLDKRKRIMVSLKKREIHIF